MASSSNPSAYPASHNTQQGERTLKPASSLEDIGVYQPRKLWRKEEDFALLNHVVWHGPKHWKLISDKLPGRLPDNCRNRWWRQLFQDVHLNPLLYRAVLSMMAEDSKYDMKHDDLIKRRESKGSFDKSSGRKRNYAVMCFVPSYHDPQTKLAADMQHLAASVVIQPQLPLPSSWRRARYFDFLGVGPSLDPPPPSSSRPPQCFNFMGLDRMTEVVD